MTRFRRKVIAIVITLAMILTSMSTVFAIDNSTTYQESANILQGYGVLVGDGQGDLMLDQTLLRQDAVVISLRLMGIPDEEFENYEIPSDFTDISNDYYLPIIGMAQDLGLIEGMGDGTFGFNQLISAQQLEAILLRALGYETTGANYEQVPQLAEQLGIANLVTAASDEAITRDKVAQMMLNTLNTPVNGETQKLGEKLGFMEAPLTGPTSFTAAATAESALKVTFDAAAADTSAVTFAVKKDDVTVNISSTAWNTEKTEATLTMVSKLSEGDYVITVGGITLTTATATVAVVDEETGKIEFTSDKAVLAAAEPNNVYAYIKVYNQYNEDITEDATLTFTASNSTAIGVQDENGKLLISGAYEVGDVITATALDAESGAFATAALTVSAVAAADQTTIARMYNADEDAVLDVNATPADFHLLLTLKDQYGHDMVAADATAGLLASVSNESILTVGAFEDLTVDDVDYIALPLATIGDDGAATIRLISTTTGKTATFEVTVKEAAKVDTITLTNPLIAVSGEDIDFEVSAVDQYGNAVTDAADLNAAATGVEVTISGSGIINDDLSAVTGTFVKENGKLLYRVDASGMTLTDNKTMYLTAITATNNVVQKSITVKVNAVPTVIARLQDVKTGIVEGNTSAITASTDEDTNNLVVYDQYDRVMDLDAAFFADYKIVFSVADADYVDFDGLGGLTVSITATDGSATIYGNTKGSELVTAEIWALNGLAADTLVADSGLDFTTTVVEIADIASYGVEDIDTVYATSGEAEDYTIEVDVYGVLANGTKVALPTSMYSIVSATTGLTVANTNELDATAAGITWATDSKTATGSVVITIGGAEGPVSFTKEVALSKVAPAATAFELVEVPDGADGDALADVTVDGDTATALVANATAANMLLAIEITDQYGVVIADDPTSIIFSNAYDANDAGLVLTNGAVGVAAIAGAAAGDTFTMTAIYSNGISHTMNIVVE